MMMRYDGLEVDVTIHQPIVRMHDAVTGQNLVECNCTICTKCWIEGNEKNGTVRCIYAGPFIGYEEVARI